MDNILDPLVQRVILESSVVSNENQNQIPNEGREQHDNVRGGNSEGDGVSSCISISSDSSDAEGDSGSGSGSGSGSDSKDEDYVPENSKLTTPGRGKRSEMDDSYCSTCSSGPDSQVDDPNDKAKTSAVDALLKEYNIAHQAFIQKLRATLEIPIPSSGEHDEVIRLAEEHVTFNGVNEDCDSPVRLRRHKTFFINATPPDQESPEDGQNVSTVSVCEGSENSTSNTKENAMLNHVILKGIFKCLPAKDLKAFRLVNKLWNEISTLSILNRRLCKICLTQSGSVAALNTCIETTMRACQKFPANSLHLNLNLSLSRAEFTKFFKLYGSHIKEITMMTTDHSRKPMNMFRNLLTKQLPKVEHIEMLPFFVRPAPNDTSSTHTWRLFPPQDNVPNVSLPLIKTIRFESTQYAAMLQDLLVASINLKEIINFKVQNTQAVVGASKTEAVKELRFLFDEKYVNGIRRFAEAGPKLEYLNLFRFKASVGLSLNHSVYLTMILSSSRETLKRLRVPCMGFLSEVTFPDVLPNLEEICVYDMCDRLVDHFNVDLLKPVFSHWMSVRHNFPKLEKLILEFYRFTNSTIEKYFPTIDYDENEELGGIRHLELAGKFDRAGLQLLAKKFPNVKKVVIRNSGDYFTETQSLWFFPWNQLESLELHGFALQRVPSYSLAVSINGGQTCSFDAFFTGIPEVICKTLKNVEEHTSLLGPCCLNIVQIDPSISCLQELTGLKIFLDHPRNAKVLDNTSVEGNISPLCDFEVSQVSKECAFDRMPKLERVVFIYDHNSKNSADISTALSSLASTDYIMFSHEPISYVESDFFTACNGTLPAYVNQSESEDSSTSDSEDYIDLD